MTRRILRAVFPLLIAACASGQCDRWEALPGPECARGVDSDDTIAFFARWEAGC